MESDGEKGMEELEKDLQRDKALAVIWSEIHCLHDDIEFMMDFIRNVNEHVGFTSSHVSSLVFGLEKRSTSLLACSCFGVLLSYVLNRSVYLYSN